MCVLLNLQSEPATPLAFSATTTAPLAGRWRLAGKVAFFLVEWNAARSVCFGACRVRIWEWAPCSCTRSIMAGAASPARLSRMTPPTIGKNYVCFTDSAIHFSFYFILLASCTMFYIQDTNEANRICTSI